MSFSRICGIAWMACTAAVASAYGAEQTLTAFPVKPIRIVVPLAPGGGVDIISRAVAQKMTESLRQTVLVDNRPGGATIIGTEIVAKAPPDGYTLVMASSSHAIMESLYKPPFDPVRDFSGRA